MGEHLLCTQEVIGSNPLASIDSERDQRASTLKPEYNPSKKPRQSKRTDCKRPRREFLSKVK